MVVLFIYLHQITIYFHLIWTITAVSRCLYIICASSPSKTTSVPVRPDSHHHSDIALILDYMNMFYCLAFGAMLSAREHICMAGSHTIGHDIGGLLCQEQPANVTCCIKRRYLFPWHSNSSMLSFQFNLVMDHYYVGWGGGRGVQVWSWWRIHSLWPSHLEHAWFCDTSWAPPRSPHSTPGLMRILWPPIIGKSVHCTLICVYARLPA